MKFTTLVGTAGPPHIGVVHLLNRQVLGLIAAFPHPTEGLAFVDTLSLIRTEPSALDAAGGLLHGYAGAPALDLPLSDGCLFATMPAPRSIHDFVTFSRHVVNASVARRSLAKIRMVRGDAYVPPPTEAPEVYTRHHPRLERLQQFRRARHLAARNARNHKSVQEQALCSRQRHRSLDRYRRRRARFLLVGHELAGQRRDMAHRQVANMIHAFEDVIACVSQHEPICPGKLFGSGTACGAACIEVDRLLSNGNAKELEVEGILWNRITPPCPNRLMEMS